MRKSWAFLLSVVVSFAPVYAAEVSRRYETRVMTRGANNNTDKNIQAQRSVTKRGASNTKSVSRSRSSGHNVETASVGTRAVATGTANTGRAATNRNVVGRSTVATARTATNVGTRTSARNTATRINNLVASRAVSLPSVKVGTNNGGLATRAAGVVKNDEFYSLAEKCKAQYTDCMDNFCNVLDDDQGRCSCSKNIKNYAKTEEALKLATEKLQDVAQKIQYIGLTADEVETLFAQTAAEEAMQSNSDSSQ
ncbi:MAG: hypothetical protein J6L70_00005, partial [Alphaproteobacteria bacterium]|nr:hypothetical protein [Alphaproteobacteria bacterium]